MDKPTIDLATNEELVEELMNRTNFIGVLVHVTPEISGKRPRRGDPVKIIRSPKLSMLDGAQVLASAVRELLSAMAKGK